MGLTSGRGSSGGVRRGRDGYPGRENDGPRRYAGLAGHADCVRQDDYRARGEYASRDGYGRPDEHAGRAAFGQRDALEGRAAFGQRDAHPGPGGYPGDRGRPGGYRRRGYRRRRGISVPVISVVAVLASVAVVAAAAGLNRMLTARPAAADAPAVDMNCTLIVPADPLTAEGLATPYQLTATDPANGPCSEASTSQTAFVQGAVLDPATGGISVYNPLVIDAGTQPAIAPVVPALPAGAVVAVWFGFNGNTLTLAGADQAQALTAPGSTATAPSSPAQGAPSGAATASGAPTAAGSPASSVAPGADPSASPAAAPPSQPAGSPAASGSPSAAGSAPGTTGPSGAGPVSASASAGTATTPPAVAGDGPAAAGTPDPILQQANCVAGQNIGGQFSSFTQVGACNAVAFFSAANAAIRAGKLTVPAPGTAADGKPCPTTRSFALIDQDQSDNVTTQYLAEGNGQTAQDTAANRQAMTGAAELFNGSDNGLLDLFVDPALGCTPWEAPNLADGGTPAPALPLDELQAARYAGARGNPAALVPLNDPMTLDNNGQFSTDKTNTYRSLVDMPPLPAGESPGTYCLDMERIQSRRLQQDVNLLTGRAGPAPDAANSLFTFLAMRLQQSFVNLSCGSFGIQNAVSVTVDASGVVVAACFRNHAAPVTPGPGNPMGGTPTCPASTAATSPSGAASQPGAGPGSPASAPASAPAASPSSTARQRHYRHHHWWW